jgi:hypothetical protein
MEDSRRWAGYDVLFAVQTHDQQLGDAACKQYFVCCHNKRTGHMHSKPNVAKRNCGQCAHGKVNCSANVRVMSRF